MITPKEAKAISDRVPGAYEDSMKDIERMIRQSAKSGLSHVDMIPIWQQTTIDKLVRIGYKVTASKDHNMSYYRGQFVCCISWK